MSPGILLANWVDGVEVGLEPHGELIFDHA
jgi:hypothetical protein